LEKILSLVWGQGQAAPEAPAGITFAQDEATAFPPQEAGSVSPSPFQGGISALWFQAEWTGPQTMGMLGHAVQLLH
jgi:hypothetical protein